MEPTETEKPEEKTEEACKQLGRNFIGFEINSEYVKIANKRLTQEILKLWKY